PAHVSGSRPRPASRGKKPAAEPLADSGSAVGPGAVGRRPVAPPGARAPRVPPRNWEPLLPGRQTSRSVRTWVRMWMSWVEDGMRPQASTGVVHGTLRKAGLRILAPELSYSASQNLLGRAGPAGTRGGGVQSGLFFSCSTDGP